MGLLPSFEDYPRKKVCECLDSHDDARLTPTLARRYLDLLDRYDVEDWKCQKCASRYPYGEIESSLDGCEALLCPSCRNDGAPVPLMGPSPEDQNDHPEVSD